MSDDANDALGVNKLPAGETDRLRTFIETWTTHLVAGRIADWERCWSEDAVLMPAHHARVVGRAAIRGFVTRELGATRGFRFSDWSYAGQDDLAVVANQITIDIGGDADPSAAAFNQIIVLRRDDGGDWRIQTVAFMPAS